MARRSRKEDAEELRAHLELATRKYIAGGMPPAEARRRAVLEFGGLEKTLEECREVNSWGWVESIVRSARHSLRSLGRNPAFTFVSLLLLTIGIASNVAVFSTLDALFFRPLPIERPGEVVRIASLDKSDRAGTLPSTMLDGLASNRAFNGICGFSTSYLAAELAGGMRQLGMAAFSGGCFATLGLHLQLGRAITPDDDHPNTPRVAVITDALWREAFGGRPDVLGNTIRLEDEIFTIVGVAQKAFTGLLLGFPEPIMIPLQQPFRTRSDRRMTYWQVTIFARRAAGISDSQALASVASSQARLLEQSVPPRYNAIQRKDFLAQKLTATPARNGLDYFLRRRFGDILYAIFGLSATILLMTCLNLISLLLARSVSRRHEVAVRLAIGARPAHIAMLFILENTVLLFLGAVLGVLAGLWSARAVLTNAGHMFESFDLNIAFDLRVALFLGAILLLVFAIFTGASVWQTSRLASAEVLKRTVRTFQNGFVQKTLLAMHIALTVALVSGASLFGASIRNMYAIDFGIQPKNVWNIALAPRPGGYRNFNPEPYYRNLLSHLESLPGVLSASISHDVPFYDSASKAVVNAIDTAQATPEIRARILGIGDRFFETLGANIRAGEDFTRTGNNSLERSVIITKSLAERLGDPNALVGHHLRIGADSKYQRVRVAGVSSNMDLNLVDLENQRPYTAFTNFWQDRELQRYPVIVIRMSSHSLDPSAVRRVVEHQGREYVQRFTTLTDEIDNALIENRFLAYLSGAFGALALAVAAVGLFGLLSYQVSNRTAEIGIRMALGAKPLKIQTLFFSQVAKLLLIGAIAGAGLLFGVQKAIASFLFGASASNLSLFAFSIGLLVATALAASWIPVRRASRVDPSQALHHP